VPNDAVRTLCFLEVDTAPHRSGARDEPSTLTCRDRNTAHNFNRQKLVVWIWGRQSDRGPLNPSSLTAEIGE
jgi:hypothetical protein